MLNSNGLLCHVRSCESAVTVECKFIIRPCHASTLGKYPDDWIKKSDCATFSTPVKSKMKRQRSADKSRNAMGVGADSGGTQTECWFGGRKKKKKERSQFILSEAESLWRALAFLLRVFLSSRWQLLRQRRRKQEDGGRGERGDTLRVEHKRGRELRWDERAGAKRPNRTSVWCYYVTPIYTHHSFSHPGASYSVQLAKFWDRERKTHMVTHTNRPKRSFLSPLIYSPE